MRCPRPNCGGTLTKTGSTLTCLSCAREFDLNGQPLPPLGQRVPRGGGAPEGNQNARKYGSIEGAIK